MLRSVVIGVDSGTQSTKSTAVDIESGEVLAVGRAPHSGGSTQHPNEWLTALRDSIRQVTSDEYDVQGLAIAGQQHGCVLIEQDGSIVRPAPLWNNTDSAEDALRLASMADFPSEVGLALVPSITITKLAHIYRTNPIDVERAHAVCLPHDWLNFQLTGELTTDRGDASGTGWWSPRTNRYRRDLLAHAVGEEHAERLSLPEVRMASEPAGALTDSAAKFLQLPPGIPLGPGTGDNMAAALGVGIGSAEMVVSLGTSGTAFTVSETIPETSPIEISWFADATGRFLPLACVINCTQVIDHVSDLTGLSRAEVLEVAGKEVPGANGIIMLPYFGGERTPNLPNASAAILGVTSSNATTEALARAALDGVAASLANCVDLFQELGIEIEGLTVVGGAAVNPVWQQAIADATGVRVTTVEGEEHASRGASMQIAAIIRDIDVAELARMWRPPVVSIVEPRKGMRERFKLPQRKDLINKIWSNPP